MPKAIVVVGYGPGVSNAVAEKFGAAGFSVAIVARNGQRLAERAQALVAKGIKTIAIAADAGDHVAIAAAVAKARAELGTITVLHWNAIGGLEVGDVMAVEPSAVGAVFNVGAASLLSALREVLPDLKSSNGALLVTNGALGEMSTQMDEFAVGIKAMGLAMANAAKAKLVGILAQSLKSDGVYVGEVTIAGMVKKNAGDQGIESADVASMFWDLYQARSEIRARIA